MSQKSLPETTSGERLIRDIRRATRRQYSAEENIRIVVDGLRGESSIAELCRREGTDEHRMQCGERTLIDSALRHAIHSNPGQTEPSG